MEAVLTNVIETKETTLETKEDRIKTHPRMYPVAKVYFECDAALNLSTDGNVDIPFDIKNSIMRAIETAGYSLTINSNGSVVVNAIRKQLQHDA